MPKTKPEVEVYPPDEDELAQGCHELNTENTRYRPNGGRDCRVCARMFRGKRRPK